MSWVSRIQSRVAARQQPQQQRAATPVQIRLPTSWTTPPDRPSEPAPVARLTPQAHQRSVAQRQEAPRLQQPSRPAPTAEPPRPRQQRETPAMYRQREQEAAENPPPATRTPVQRTPQEAEEPRNPGVAKGLGGPHRPPKAYRDAVRGATRTMRMVGPRELGADEYSALSGRQQAAVQFNTGLISAARQDDAAGDTKATERYLGQLGLDQGGVDMNEYLQLDQIITDSILEQLDSPPQLVPKGDPARVGRGAPGAAREQRRYSDAQNNANATAGVMAQQLHTTGQPRMGEEGDGELRGFGTGPADEVVQRAYLLMVNGNYDYTVDQVVEGLSYLNADKGTDVTPEDVWAYLDAQIAATTYARVGNESSTLPVPETDPWTGDPIAPLDPADIRQRYLGG